MAEQMKPSGIDWIGEIPQGWNLKRIKYLSTLKGRIGWQGLTADEYVDEGPFLITGTDFINGTINWDTCVHITEERWGEAPEIHIKNGDLLITKDGTVGKVAIVSNLEGKASLNSGVLLIRTFDGFDKRFLYWTLLSDEFWAWFKLKNAGNSTIIHLYQNDFAEFCYTFPNVIEQKAIADFLDEQCGRIDGIISDLEKQIEILQKFKKSLILETVTKGLNKNVPMKPSGIDWIGDIPATWDIKRIKDVSKMQTGTTPPNNEGVNIDGDGVNWFTPGDFKDGSIELLNSEKFVNDETIQRESIKIYPQYSILFVGIASIGKLGYFENACYSNQQITAIKTNNMENSKFIACSLMASMDYTKSNALYTTVPIINNAYLGVIKIPFPKEKEQKEIVFYLDKKCLQIDEIVKGKKEQLEKIKQHKKSLIYEYVTGKKRVREATNGN